MVSLASSPMGAPAAQAAGTRTGWRASELPANSVSERIKAGSTLLGTLPLFVAGPFHVSAIKGDR